MPSIAAENELGRFLEVRAATEELAAPLSPEDQVVQSMTECSPTKWHRAHTTWFWEEFVLGGFAEGYLPVDPDYRFLFNSYYEAVGPRQPRPFRGMITRPSVEDVAVYRRRVDAAVEALLADEALDFTGQLPQLMELGRNHEQQHQELLLMDIKNLFSRSPLRPGYAIRAEGTAEAEVKPISWVGHDGGVVEIGHDGDGFAFDNEGPRHKAYLEPFALADRLVTAGEWLEFIEDDGYHRSEFWLSDGWAHINEHGSEAPLYWERLGDQWQVFTLYGLEPVDPAAPVVHVSYYEADAFARWSGARLPTESEWEAVAGRVTIPQRSEVELHPNALDHDPPPIAQLYGEVWQWTSTAYSPYPGFRAAPGAVGEYNGKFMVDQYVLRGSACVTPLGHERLSYRNFFPSAAQWAFSGLRLAQDG